MMQSKMNWKLILMLPVFVFGFLACGSNKTAPIDSEKMKSILFDLQVAEAYSANVDTGAEAGKKNQDTLSYYYALVLQRHGIGLEEWEDAMEWYLKHPATFDSIFTQITDTAGTFKTKEKKDASETDSLASQQQQPEEDTSMDLEAGAPSTGSRRPFRPATNNKVSIKEDLVDPERQAEIDAIKQKSKEKREALEKVKNEK